MANTDMYKILLVNETSISLPTHLPPGLILQALHIQLHSSASLPIHRDRAYRVEVLIWDNRSGIAVPVMDLTSTANVPCFLDLFTPPSLWLCLICEEMFARIHLGLDNILCSSFLPHITKDQKKGIIFEN